MEEKQKQFTSGVENSQAEEKKTSYNPLRDVDQAEKAVGFRNF